LKDSKKKKVASTIKRPKILIVEDENIIALDIQYILENLGYSVSDVVSSGEESIEKASKIRPDLILMDIKLKGNIDGITAAEQIYNRFQIPVIYLTAYGNEGVMKRAKKVRHFGYINKPFEERELQTVIEGALIESNEYSNDKNITI